MSTDSDLIPVVDYARASIDMAKDEHTVSDQQTVNERTAARLGCRIVGRFFDNDKSAAKEGMVRDGFEAMLRVVRAGAPIALDSLGQSSKSTSRSVWPLPRPLDAGRMGV